MSQAEVGAKPSPLQGVLDWIERVGNKVPHPVIIFLILIAFIMVLSAAFQAAGSTVTFEQAQIGAEEPVTVTVAAQSLLDADGLRFVFTSPVANFNNFGVVGVIVVAMIGVGMAEEVGLIASFIKRLVKVTPPRAITFIIVLLGVLSSIATDAGYLVLIPLAAAVFLSLGRHPLAGLAAAFAGVGGGFAVNVLITPVDGMLAEITNEAIADPANHVAITGNLFFGIVSTLLVTVVVTLLTEKFVEPRLGAYHPSEGPETADEPPSGELSAEEKNGLRWAFWAFLGTTAVVLALSLPPNALLRNPETGSLIEDSPLLNSIIFLILVYFFVMGLAYGKGAGTIHGSMDVINPMTKTIAGLSGLIFLLLVISQFIAYFNYSNLGTIAAVNMADTLEAANLSTVWLILGLIAMTAIIDIFIGGVVPKWAIFAPVFVPLFIQLGISPDLAMAAYRVGDSPVNVATPLMPYFALIVIFAERYRRKVGVGSVISLMLPYTVVLLITWSALLVVWYLLGIPLGPGASIYL
ncbi:AbgT family transporter [Cellulomonas sp. Root137]|uniref:AbgT family transporter n=1 Tax=Cellulomonas sp. Root137 TaxID=1736459 RepID=UPI0006FD65AF|nr:AbgT family transporter [Cellulomonas sp. Root137]KQY46514.1 p-aminobenzoyl-glutamate transporter [Cellulomonas sp. Root137]